MPEIADGVVEIKACAREPGHRTKIAVWSNDHNVDPVGACVGARGARVRMVVNELRGEKIDIVPFTEDPADFVAKALSPAKVKEVRIHEDTGVAEVIVPDYQLSLAIGKEGQNARLAARLTGWRVDIKSETQLAEEEAGIFARRALRATRRRVRRGRVGRRTPRPASMEWHAAEGEVVTAEEWAGGGDGAPRTPAVPRRIAERRRGRGGRRGGDGRARGGDRRGGGRRGRSTAEPRSRPRRSAGRRRRRRSGRGAAAEAADDSEAVEAVERDQEADDAGRRGRPGPHLRRLPAAGPAGGAGPVRPWAWTGGSWSVARLPGGAPGSARVGTCLDDAVKRRCVRRAFDRASGPVVRRGRRAPGAHCS